MDSNNSRFPQPSPQKSYKSVNVLLPAGANVINSPSPYIKAEDKKKFFGTDYDQSHTQSPMNTLPNMNPYQTQNLYSKTHLSSPTRAAGEATLTKEISHPKLRVVTDPNLLPTPTRISGTLPPRDLLHPINKYPPSRKVDSRSESKVPEGDPSGLPAYFGSTFTSVPNINRAYLPQYLPPRPTLPKGYLPIDPSTNVGQGLLNNRLPNGKIIGTTAPKYVNENHVPMLPVEEPVGPDNPYVQMNDTWTKCWDKEAGAVYYYNQVTGEATWIQPEI